MSAPVKRDEVGLAVRAPSPTQRARAGAWSRALDELGRRLPAWAPHDLGLVLTEAPARLSLLSPAEPRAAAWAALVHDVAASPLAREARELGLNDDFLVALLARVLAPISRQADPLEAARVRSRQIRALLDTVDLDVARLFERAGGDAERGALAAVDLARAVEDPAASDVATFTLEVLPHALARPRPTATGRAPEAGYAGLATRGSFDSMVLTELAHHDDELVRRLLDDEVLHWARDETDDTPRTAHVVLVDASASMRGERSTFARAVAMALGKKLTLAGDAVTFRFFDGRLHPPHAAHGSRLPLAYLVGFRGERGRHPAKVLRQLARELEVRRSRDPRPLAVHLFTHASLRVPREVVSDLARLARVTAVFILPRGDAVDLDYLDRLDAHFVVDHATLEGRDTRAARARQLLDAARPRTGRPAP